jgi:glucan 1,3-beta-glucosidase
MQLDQTPLEKIEKLEQLRALENNISINVTTLDDYHEYSVEWAGSDLVYRVDGVEVHRNVGEGDNYPEPMFAILNYAKITDSPMEGEWVMEVDWVKHEFWDERYEQLDPKPPASPMAVRGDAGVTLSWDASDDPDVRYNVYRTTRPGERGERIAHWLPENTFQDSGPAQNYYYTITASKGCAESRRGDVVRAAPPSTTVPARIEAENYSAMTGIETEDCGDVDGGLNIGFFDPEDFIEFEIIVGTPGEYVIDYRLASESGSSGFEVLVNDEVVDQQSVAATGGWQTYVTQTSPGIELGEGEHTLRFRSIGNQWNINWFEIRSR